MTNPDDRPAPDDMRVFDRLLAAGLDLPTIEQHLTAGRVHLDGKLVTDPHALAPPGTRLVPLPR